MVLTDYDEEKDKIYFRLFSSDFLISSQTAKEIIRCLSEALAIRNAKLKMK